MLTRCGAHSCVACVLPFFFGKSYKSYEFHFAATSKAVARTRELTAAQGKAAQPLTNLPYTLKRILP